MFLTGAAICSTCLFSKQQAADEWHPALEILPLPRGIAMPRHRWLMLTITKEFSFHAAHRLRCSGFSEEENRRIYGNCANIHGHTYRLRVTLTGQPDETGMILHFDTLKAIVRREVLDRYDHADLTALDEYTHRPATAECMAEHIFAVLDAALRSDRYRLHEVAVYETPTAWATRTRHV